MKIQAYIDLLSAVRTQSQNCGRHLTAEERECAFRVGVVNVDQVLVWEVDDVLCLIPEQVRADVARIGILNSRTIGLTLDHLVLIKRGYLSERLLRHELRHVHQWEQFSNPLDFLSEYLRQVIQFGYLNAPFEIDARNHER